MSNGTLKHAYEQGDKVGDYVVHLDGWGKQLPARAGWYWVSVLYPNGKRYASIIYLDDGNTFAAPTEWNDENREYVNNLGKDLRFVGPIPEPEPPV